MHDNYLSQRSLLNDDNNIIVNDFDLNFCGNAGTEYQCMSFLI